MNKFILSGAAALAFVAAPASAQLLGGVTGAVNGAVNGTLPAPLAEGSAVSRTSAGRQRRRQCCRKSRR